MPITLKGVDLTNIIQTGTSSLTGFTGITGLSRSVAWEGCSDLGITKNGVDIANSFTAKYVDYNITTNDVTIPTGVNQLKVFCIGGGGGGSGGNVGHRNYSYQLLGYNSGRYPSPRYGYVYGPSSLGNTGQYGSYGQYNSEIFNINDSKYSVTVGTGGTGGTGGESTMGLNFPGNSGTNGNDTKFSIGNNNLLSIGGIGGQSYRNLNNREFNIMLPNSTNPTSYPPSDRPVYPISGGNAGNAEYTIGGTGDTGNAGFCRVYYLY